MVTITCGLMFMRHIRGCHGSNFRFYSFNSSRADKALRYINYTKLSIPGCTEFLYFKNVMENNKKYPDCNFEAILSSSESQTGNTFFNLLQQKNSGSDEVQILNGELELPLKELDGSIISVDQMIELYAKLFTLNLSWNICKQLLPMDSVMKNKFRSLPDKAVGKVITLAHLIKRSRVNSPSLLFNVRHKLHSQLIKLTDVQLIEYFYYQHFAKAIPNLRATEFQNDCFVGSRIPHLTLSEVAVICHAYFRSEKIPGYALYGAVAERCLNDLGQMDDFQAGVISKFLFYGGKLKFRPVIKEILNKAYNIVDKLTLCTAIHICSMGININVGSPELVKKLFERVKKEKSTVRLKEIERLVLAAAFFNVEIINDSEFLAFISAILELKAEDIQNYPRSFLSLLNFLIVHGIFLEDAIDYALSDTYLEICKTKHKKSAWRELLFIDLSLELERPKYKGKRLSDKLRKKISKCQKFLPSVEENSSSWIFLNEANEFVTEAYGSEYCAIRQINPHYASFHLILRLNKKNEPQIIGDMIHPHPSTGIIVRAPSDGNRWICFVLVRKQGCLDDDVTLNFTTKAKLRHLEIAGYVPIVAYFHVWEKLTKEEKCQFIRESLGTNYSKNMESRLS